MWPRYRLSEVQIYGLLSPGHGLSWLFGKKRACRRAGPGLCSGHPGGPRGVQASLGPSGGFAEGNAG